ncbi:39S ribosomal protein L42, mitochondrial-like isoform X2 [Acanthaster planci]|uniref:Large ribosomal subunit protein mL42 n=1 Tax=Acanthaster planci TaxID=133434 RepID=A0A8B7Z1M9_ACAPL|nr:39S ribosomal protein L42, mitochondrial-like isoform X2 [Acanthaster planci]
MAGHIGRQLLQARQSYASLVIIIKRLNILPLERAGCRQFFSSRSIQNDGQTMVETADGNTIVCYHPTEPFPYENTKPMPRPDPSKPEEAVDSILKMKFGHESFEKERRGPNVHELAKMFYTTKHRWYPLGIRRRNKVARNPPRDRPYL